jgi:hypothetical protein
VTDNCFANSDPSLAAPGGADAGLVSRSPRTDAFCHVDPSWSSSTQFKLAVVYPLFWNIQTSAMYQNLAGLPILATREYTNAEIAPSLGRALAQGAAGTVQVELIPQGTQFMDRRNQLDFRLSRIFAMGRTKLQANVDIYNVFNANYSLTYNTTYGPEWLKPQTILLARLVKLGVNFSF